MILNRGSEASLGFRQHVYAQFYAQISQKRKNSVMLSHLFAILGSLRVKASSKISMKLTTEKPSGCRQTVLRQGRVPRIIYGWEILAYVYQWFWISITGFWFEPLLGNDQGAQQNFFLILKVFESDLIRIISLLFSRSSLNPWYTLYKNFRRLKTADNETDSQFNKLFFHV